MSDFTAVNAAAMQEGISDLNQAHKSLTDQLETLESQLSGSLAQWDGAARSAYATAKDRPVDVLNIVADPGMLVRYAGIELFVQQRIHQAERGDHTGTDQKSHRTLSPYLVQEHWSPPRNPAAAYAAPLR